MKIILLLLALSCSIYYVQGGLIKCSEKCKAPECSCFSSRPPFNHSKEDIPQFIIMTFDEAVRDAMAPVYLGLSNFTNPNGCPIQATFFVSHVDTNYKLVSDLHRRGHEIAAHSITKNPSQNWADLDLEGWRQEFGGVRRIISKFADIPIKEIVGARAPKLQTAGNITFTALKEEGFRYDCSQPSRRGHDSPFFPYTLDFGFQADCQIPPCLKEDQLYPGFWSVPMNDWFVKVSEGNDQPCATVDACVIYENGTYIPSPTVDEFVKLFEDNFNRFYESNRAPFPLFLRDAWLSYDSTRQTALLKFIEKINQKKDVFFVSISEVIDWMGRGANGTEIHNYNQKTCVKHLPENKCGETDILEPKGNCKYQKVPVLKGQDKTMVVCNDVECPKEYPWLTNN